MGEDRKDDELVPTNQSLTTYLEQVRAKYEGRGSEDLESEARTSAKEIHETIAPGGKFPPEQQWLPFAPMPTDMCRVSPFFPLAPQNMSKREYIQDMVITKSAWGEIHYSGPKLTTYEEDVLMALLAIMKEAKRGEETEVEGKTTYSYTGPLLPILRLMGKKSPNSKEYARTLSALKMLHSAVVEMSLKSGRRKIANILIHTDASAGREAVSVAINPYFYEMYIGGSITLLDVVKRSRIRSPIAKSLYRFVQSHRDYQWRGHFMTLAAALNLDMELPPYKIRDRLKSAIAALKKLGYLARSSRFKTKDIVELASKPALEE